MANQGATASSLSKVTITLLAALKLKQTESRRIKRELERCHEQLEASRTLRKESDMRQLEELMTMKAEEIKTHITRLLQENTVINTPSSSSPLAAAAQAEDTSHARLIDALHGELEVGFEPRCVSAWMYEHNALTKSENHSIQCEADISAAVRRLLACVRGQSQSAFQCFVDALRDTKQDKAYQMIVNAGCEELNERSEHARLFKRSYTYLLDTLDTTSLVDELYTGDVISQREAEQVRQEKSSFTRNAKLLHTISYKTKEQFDKFLEALDSSGQRHVRDKIIAAGRGETNGNSTPTTCNGETSPSAGDNISGGAGANGLNGVAAELNRMVGATAVGDLGLDSQLTTQLQRQNSELQEALELAVREREDAERREQEFITLMRTPMSLQMDGRRSPLPWIRRRIND